MKLAYSVGLGSEYWYEVIEALRKIIPVYDKVNRAISFGKIAELREEGIKILLEGKSSMLILDAGSGYGNMSSTALAISSPNIVMLDPIPEMLALAKHRSRVSGIFEHLPFQDRVFDGIMCGYSFRDAINYRDAIAEFSRVLKDDGRLLIVDLGKPDNLLFRFGASLYLRFILGFIAFLIAGRLGLHFRAIYGTYKRLPTNSSMANMLKEKFREVNVKSRMMGGAVIFIAYK